MIRTDSRLVKPGDTFVAVRGASVDGARFIPAAIAAGAAEIVCEDPPPADPPAGVVWTRTADSRAAAAQLACAETHDPSHELSVFAVTGTNGKTTIANLVRKVLSDDGRRCGLLSTIENDFGGGRAEPARNTTPGPLELQHAFRAMRGNGCDACAMEVSSHALDQKRADGTRFACAAFTNLTRDHLDYHGTMDAYFAAKSRLFLELDVGAAAVNADDAYGARLADAVKARGGVRTLTYGFSADGDVRIADAAMTPAGTSFAVVFGGTRFTIASRLLGRHNALNLAAAFASATLLGVDPQAAARSLSAAEPVRGRLEPVAVPGSPAAFFVDYAHTPDALENVLRTLRELTRGRLFVVFGAGGDRDRTKRAPMGEACARLADVLIPTSDNPRSEDPAKILGDVLEGVRRVRPALENVRAEIDRGKALRLARELADRGGDVVLVAGKGHENYQIFADRTIHFDDREELLAGS